MKYFLFLLIYSWFSAGSCFGQSSKSEINFSQGESIRIMFYNVENLFDTRDDSLKRDDEFTPDGDRHWVNYKFYKKLNQIYKTIIGLGQWDSPALIGLCEIENRYVLNQLVYQTPLKDRNYRIIHEESPDKRGIDVAALYKPDIIKYLAHKPINISFPFAPESKTRDILYAKFQIFNSDTLHFFINHWPSRYGGYMATKPKREYVASVLRSAVDSIREYEPNAFILITGDFNDEPDNESLTKALGACADTANCESELLNLMFAYHRHPETGTHKYRESWGVLDQFIVSTNLVKQDSKVFVKDSKAQIYQSNFLMEKDDKYLGLKPFRTFVGFKYNGGFSDHLPIFLDIVTE